MAKKYTSKQKNNNITKIFTVIATIFGIIGIVVGIFYSEKIGAILCSIAILFYIPSIIVMFISLISQIKAFNKVREQLNKEAIYISENEVVICELLKEIENRKQELEKIDEVNQKVIAEYLEKIEIQKQELANIDVFKQKVRIEAIAEIDDIIKEKQERILGLDQICVDKNKAIEAQNDILAKTNNDVQAASNKLFKLRELYKSFNYAIKVYETDGMSKLNEALINNIDPSIEPIINIELNCLNVKQLKQRYNYIQSNIQDVFRRYESRYNSKTNIAIYKLMVIALEAELQNTLVSLKYNKLQPSIDAVKDITARYLSIAVDGNQSIAPTMKKFIGEIEYLFIEVVKIEYEYYVQKERIKEEQRAIKEQMRQEAEEHRLLEQEKKKIEKEETKFNNAINEVAEQIKNCVDSELIAQLEERKAELENQLAEVENKKEEIVNLQNGKAGYVYVISNLGSFGDHVFKVGMTRRSDPMDRVKELGDASVPFNFDVHSFIFSDDAVDLENTLHKELNDRRVNKINLRKEFFDITIDELEELVYKHNPTAEFNRTMLAEEYNQGIAAGRIAFQLNDNDIADIDALDEE